MRIKIPIALQIAIFLDLNLILIFLIIVNSINIIFLFIDIPFPSIKMMPKEANICCICLQNISIATSPNKCRHIFCNSCITRWSKKQKICPLCRTPFTKVMKLNNNSKEFIFVGDKSKLKYTNLNNNKYPKSQKMLELSFCSICGKPGIPSEIFTCQICKIFNAHYYCSDINNFELGIFICPGCQNLRANKLNEI